MITVCLTWNNTSTLPPGESVVQRVYRWGSYLGFLNLTTKNWTVWQTERLQETPLLEQWNPVSRAAPPTTIDDAWEETIQDHGDYESIEGSLLRICMTSTNYKSHIMKALSLGCPIDSSILRSCETVFQETPTLSHEIPPVLVPTLREVKPTPPTPLTRSVPPHSNQGDRRLPQGDRRPPQGDRRPPQGDRRLPQGDRRPPQGDRSRPYGGGHRAPLAAAPAHRTLSATPSGWLGTED
jgi:hypothetical protein